MIVYFRNITVANIVDFLVLCSVEWKRGSYPYYIERLEHGARYCDSHNSVEVCSLSISLTVLT